MSFLFDFQDRRTYFGIGMAVLILVLPLFLNAYWTDVCVSIGLYAILALSLKVILGQAGIFHMGHAAFYAVGAYVTAILNTMFHWSIFWTMPRGPASPPRSSPSWWRGPSFICAATIS